MGARPNPDCFTCGKDIKPDDRAVIVNVTRGRAGGLPDYESNSIFHESCYLDKGKPEKAAARLTQEQIQDYLNSAGVNCPYCGASDLEAGSFDGEGMYQPVECNKCGREWRDAFSLVAIEECMS